MRQNPPFDTCIRVLHTMIEGGVCISMSEWSFAIPHPNVPPIKAYAWDLVKGYTAISIRMIMRKRINLSPATLNELK